MHRWWMPLVALLAIVPAGCRTPEPATTAAAPTTTASKAVPAKRWHYTVRVDESLVRLELEVCFEQGVPASLRPQMGASFGALRAARRVEGGAPLHITDKAVLTGDLETGQCAALEFDVDALLSSAGSRADAMRYPHAVVLSPDFWLWSPDRRARGFEATARFELPEDISVAVPWPRMDDGRYRVSWSTFKWRNHAAMGRLEHEVMEVPGAALEISWVGGAMPLGKPRLRRWLRQAAEVTASLRGHFPVERAQILLMPTRGDDVTFGTVARGGGPSVALMVGKDIDEAALEDDWVATHEMVHLWLPKIKRADAWLYEGFATYYEAILRARTGDITPLRAMERLHDGFERGRRSGSGRTLQQESIDMFQTYAFWRVYWSGAALALKADVALRTGQGADKSLDDQIARIESCCRHKVRSWTAAELLEEASGGRPEGLGFEARRHLGGVDFPDMTETYQALGWRIDANGMPAQTAADALWRQVVSPQ